MRMHCTLSYLQRLHLDSQCLGEESLDEFAPFGMELLSEEQLTVLPETDKNVGPFS